jgi:hypothetical protein
MAWYEKNKETINAKRREKRRLEKAQNQNPPGLGAGPTV